MRTILPSEMKTLETQFMEKRGIPSLLLMERAAAGILEAISRHADPALSVLFLCGCGNNGGDGFAAARLWQNKGGTSIIWRLPGNLSRDAAVNLKLAEEAGATIVVLNEVPDHFPMCGLIVDAIFGTGLSRPPEGVAAQLINKVNETGIPVISVDIPSGLDAATGRADGAAVHANETVTFHRIKTGLLLRDGCEYTGQVTCWPILIPESEDPYSGLSVLTEAEAKAKIPKRKASGYKGTYGTSVLMVGSVGMAGAAALCAETCIRSGSGLTRILCPSAIVPILQMLVPGAICISLPEDAEEAVLAIRKALKDARKAAVGCGIGQNEQLIPLLQEFTKAGCPVIWDADALNLLATHRDLLPLPEKDTITPHPGETARMLQCTVAEVLSEPIESIKTLRQLCGCNVLLKGARSLMTDGRDYAVNPIGTPALSKGGSGDILTGLICGLTGQGNLSGLEVMQLACYLQVKAAERAAAVHGVTSVTPEEIAHNIVL